MYQCFKTVRGTDFDKAVKKHFEQKPKWKDVISKVGELLNEKINEMGLAPDNLWVNTREIHREENKKLFTKEGKLKTNSKRAKEIYNQYRNIVKETGLNDFQELRLIKFCYGVMRLQGQYLDSFVDSEYDIYYKADFDLAKRSKGLVTPISEIEYEEKYLEELKKGQ
ncbi:MULTISPECIES: hypothetical protein [unclassified Paenibacillus]|uniref:hypothetical protein n=1 Tax=unclassified Paenibacillus TaxID=185978 RepID=UPI0036D3E9DE